MKNKANVEEKEKEDKDKKEGKDKRVPLYNQACSLF